jgi:hypothetical protein
MTVLYVGDRVTVTKQWSSFYGMRGVLMQIRPFTMVLFDGDKHPLRIEEPTIVRDVPVEPHVGGAE